MRMIDITRKLKHIVEQQDNTPPNLYDVEICAQTLLDLEWFVAPEDSDTIYKAFQIVQKYLDEAEE